MNISDLIDHLSTMLDTHGDQPVTVACGTYEYSIGSVAHADEGPLPNIANSQKQDDLPKRIVIEVKM